MSERNVEAVRRVHEGVTARLEVPRELFHPDYEFDNTEQASNVSQYSRMVRWAASNPSTPAMSGQSIVRDGKIVRLSVHTDLNRSLEAAGLSQ